MRTRNSHAQFVRSDTFVKRLYDEVLVRARGHPGVGWLKQRAVAMRDAVVDFFENLEGRQKIKENIHFISFGAKIDLNPNFSMNSLSPEQARRLIYAFGIFDRDNSGFIERGEMIQVFRMLGANPAQHEIDLMLSYIDANQDGRLGFDEFAGLWSAREATKLEANFAEEMELAFKAFDTDGNGELTREELIQKLTTLGEPLSVAEVEDMLAEADVSGDGTISLEEFKNMRCWSGTATAGFFF